MLMMLRMLCWSYFLCFRNGVQLMLMMPDVRARSEKRVPADAHDVGC